MDNNQSTVQNKNTVAIVVALVVVAIVIGLVITLFSGNDDNQEPTQNTEQPAQNTEAEATTTGESTAEGAGDQQSQDANSTSSDDQGATTDTNSSDASLTQVVSNTNPNATDGADPGLPDFVTPGNIEEAKKYYCMVQEGQSSDNWDACLSETQCTEEAAQIAGNFTCKWKDKPELNFAGGTVTNDMLKE